MVYKHFSFDFRTILHSIGCLCFHRQMFPSFQIIQRLGSSWWSGQGNSYSRALVAVQGSTGEEAQAQALRCWRQPTLPEFNPDGLGLPASFRPSPHPVPAQPAQLLGINIPGHKSPQETLNPEGVLLRGRAAFPNSC